MNWMGGARNRVKFQNERKTQKDFFERRRLNLGRPVQPNQGWAKKRKLSQDLMALQTVSAFHSKVPSTGLGKPPVKSVDLDKFKSCTEHFKEVDMGPISPTHGPSKLFVMDCKGDNKIQSAITKDGKEGSISMCNQNDSSRSGNKPICEEITQNKMSEEWAIPDTNSFMFRRKKDDGAIRRKLQSSTFDPFVSEDFQCTPLVSYETSKSKLKRQNTGMDRIEKIERHHHGSHRKEDDFRRGGKSVDGKHKYTCTSTPFDKETASLQKRKGAFKQMINFDLSPIGIQNDKSSRKRKETLFGSREPDSTCLSGYRSFSPTLQSESWLSSNTVRPQSSPHSRENEIRHQHNKQPRLDSSISSGTTNFTPYSEGRCLNLNFESKVDTSPVKSRDLELFRTKALKSPDDANKQSQRHEKLPLSSSPAVPQLHETSLLHKHIDADKRPYHTDKLLSRSQSNNRPKPNTGDRYLSDLQTHAMFDTSSLHKQSNTKGHSYLSDISPLQRLSDHTRNPYDYRGTPNQSSSVSRSIESLDTSLAQRQSDTANYPSGARAIPSFDGTMSIRKSTPSLHTDFTPKQSPFLKHSSMASSSLQPFGDRSSGYHSNKSLSETPSVHRGPTKKPMFGDFDEEFTFTPRKDMCTLGQVRNKQPDVMTLYGDQREIINTPRLNTPKSTYSNGSSLLPRSPKVAEEFPSNLQRNIGTVLYNDSANIPEKLETEKLQDTAVQSAGCKAKDMSDVLTEMTEMEKQEEELKKASQERHDHIELKAISFLPGEKRSESFEADMFFESEFQDIMNDIPIETIKENPVSEVLELLTSTEPLNSTYTVEHASASMLDYSKNEEDISNKQNHSYNLISGKESNLNTKQCINTNNPDTINNIEKQSNMQGVDSTQKFNDAVNIEDKVNKPVEEKSDTNFVSGTNYLEKQEEVKNNPNLLCGRTSKDANTLADEDCLAETMKHDLDNPSTSKQEMFCVRYGDIPVSCNDIQKARPVCFENIRVSVQDPEISSGKDQAVQCILKQTVVDRATSPFLVQSTTDCFDIGIQCIQYIKVYVDAGVQCEIDADGIAEVGVPVTLQTNTQSGMMKDATKCPEEIKYQDGTDRIAEVCDLPVQCEQTDSQCMIQSGIMKHDTKCQEGTKYQDVDKYRNCTDRIAEVCDFPVQFVQTDALSGMIKEATKSQEYNKCQEEMIVLSDGTKSDRIESDIVTDFKTPKSLSSLITDKKCVLN